MIYATLLPCGCIRYLPKDWREVRCDDCRVTMTNETTPPIKRKKASKCQSA